MKIEFPVLESEPLIYFLLHSGVFVLALACVFFILGLWMGAAVWGRYKKQLHNAREEIAGQFQEIAVLKRKLAEQTMRPSSGPLSPPAALLTEVLPSVGEIFPERAARAEDLVRHTASARRPVSAAVSPAPSLASDLAPAGAAPRTPAVPEVPVFAPAPVAAPIITLTPTPAPLVPVADAEAHADPVLSVPPPGAVPPAPETPGKRKSSTIRRPTVRVKVRKEAAAPAVPALSGDAAEPEAVDMAESFLLSELPAVKPAEDKAAAEAVSEDDDVTPFGFLLGEPAEPAPPSVSNLAEILKNAAADVKSISQPGAAVTPTPAPPPSRVAEIPSVLPEIDPALGMIYKVPPSETDDLTRIKGIASVLEKRLHELGIYTWRQIASWQESHIREFSSRLAFKDRIVREKWVEQARSLNEARHIA